MAEPGALPADARAAADAAVIAADWRTSRPPVIAPGPLMFGAADRTTYTRYTNYGDEGHSDLTQRYIEMCQRAGVEPIPPLYIARLPEPPAAPVSLTNYGANIVNIGGHYYPYITSAVFQHMSSDEILAVLGHELYHYKQWQSVNFDPARMAAFDSPQNEMAADRYAAQLVGPSVMIRTLNHLDQLMQAELQDGSAPASRVPPEDVARIRRDDHHPSFHDRIEALKRFEREQKQGQGRG